MNQNSFSEQVVVRLETSGMAFAPVLPTDAPGSPPQDTGAEMLIMAASLRSGTVGRVLPWLTENTWWDVAFCTGISNGAAGRNQVVRFNFGF